MASGKPNNLPWIILSVILGTGVLGLFAFGVFTGASSVGSEMSIRFPEAEASSLHDNRNLLYIDVNADNSILVDGDPVKSVSELKQTLFELPEFEIANTTVVLRLNEDASHRILIELKDILDAEDVISKIKIIRPDSQ